jgi:hypothetical protein
VFGHAVEQRENGMRVLALNGYEMVDTNYLGPYQAVQMYNALEKPRPKPSSSNPIFVISDRQGQ